MAMDLEMTASAQAANGNETGEAHLDMPHALVWGGISNVTANGAPVSSFSVSSDSGTDWSGGYQPPCDPDVNQDGNVDQGDIDYLINVVAGGPNDTGIDPDFNRDGNVDQGDIDSLVNVVAGGNCP
jgi:hypothetical protein